MTTEPELCQFQTEQSRCYGCYLHGDLLSVCKTLQEVAADAQVRWSQVKGHGDVAPFLCDLSKPGVPVCRQSKADEAARPQPWEGPSTSSLLDLCCTGPGRSSLHMLKGKQQVKSWSRTCSLSPSVRPSVRPGSYSVWRRSRCGRSSPSARAPARP